MDSTAVCGNLLAIEHSVIADDARYAQSVVPKNICTPPRLGLSMRFQGAPLCNRPLITKK